MPARHDNLLVTTTPSAEPPLANAGPAGTGSYVVRQGECIYSIAFREGIDPDDLWNDEGNAELRERRTAPNLLMPGDRLAIPARSARPTFAIGPGGSHTYRARIPAYQTTIQLLLGDEPRKDKRCTIVVDGQTSEQTTDAEGKLTITVRPTTRFAHVTIHDRVNDIDFDEPVEIELGGLDPLETVSGVQGRLRNLGYHLGLIDGIAGPRTRLALEAFQRANGLSVTGEPDAQTRDKLRSLSGF